MVDGFEAHRAHLHALAYRMLGASSEADDIVQEAWIRYRDAPRDALRSERAWLSTVVTRLCLDHMKSARVRRESYVGPWLPEPVRTDAAVDAESISMAFLVLLEALSPIERAAYLLHEVFEYSHGEVAEILGRDEAACRQLFHRARQHVTEGRPRFAPSREDHLRLLTGFMQAVTAGDLDGLKAVLARDAVAASDGGGKVSAARKTIHGAEAIGRFFLAMMKKAPPGPEVLTEVTDVNGWPALVFRVEGRATLVLSIETDGASIQSVQVVLNPDKLNAV